MKCLTMYQPHATLMAMGARTIETTSLDTPHRGWLALYAAKTSPEEYTGLAGIDPFTRVLNAIPGYSGVESLPAGMIVGVAWLAAVTDAYRATEHWKVQPYLTLSRDAADYDYVPKYEIAFGDYTRGRKAWWMTLIYRLPHPVPAFGPAGMWDTRSMYADATHPDLYKYLADPTEEEIRRQIGDTYGVRIDQHAMDDAAQWRIVNRRGTLGYPMADRGVSSVHHAHTPSPSPAVHASDPSPPVRGD